MNDCLTADARKQASVHAVKVFRRREMDRNTYLAELRNCLAALPVEEQDEALEYFSDFFEDAENDDKVIEELGAPDKLAEEIKAQFAWVPATIDTDVTARGAAGADGTAGAGGRGGAGGAGGNGGAGGFRPKRNAGKKSGGSTYRSAGMFFEFDTDKVKNLELALGAAEIVMIPGSRWTVETRLIEPSAFRCEVTEKGTLIVDNRMRLPNLSFWQHADRHSAPRILLTVPENASLGVFKVSLGAGSFMTKNIAISCKAAFIDVSAGNLVLGNVRGGNWTLHCGAGNMELTGTATGNCNIDCGMGRIAMNLTGNPEQYSFAGRVGLGEISFNNTKRSGVGNIDCNERMENHFSVNCGMGQVAIKMAR